MSASRLSAAAAEWTPPPPRSDTPAQQADDACWPSAEELHQWEAYDWYEEEDGGDEPQQQHQQHPQLEEGDAVALLQSCYPSHAPALLLQLVQDCGGDVQLAATILCDVASEERRERIAAAAAATGSGSGSSAAASADAQSRRQAESFALSLEQFPSLGGPSSSSSGRPAAGNSSSSWAAKAASTSTSTGSRAAPGPQLQQQQRLRRPQLQAVSSTSGRQQAAAEVPWVETGAAVSQAYAQVCCCCVACVAPMGRNEFVWCGGWSEPLSINTAWRALTATCVPAILLLPAGARRGARPCARAQPVLHASDTRVAGGRQGKRKRAACCLGQRTGRTPPSPSWLFVAKSELAAAVTGASKAAVLC
jgi:hypothetical protein